MGFLGVDITDQTGLNFCHEKHPMLLLGVGTTASTVSLQLILGIKKT